MYVQISKNFICQNNSTNINFFGRIISRLDVTSPFLAARHFESHVALFFARNSDTEDSVQCLHRVIQSLSKNNFEYYRRLLQIQFFKKKSQRAVRKWFKDTRLHGTVNYKDFIKNVLRYLFTPSSWITLCSPS